MWSHLYFFYIMKNLIQFVHFLYICIYMYIKCCTISVYMTFWKILDYIKNPLIQKSKHPSNVKLALS